MAWSRKGRPADPVAEAAGWRGEWLYFRQKHFLV